MKIVKIALQTRSLRQPLRRALVTAAQLGAAGVEVDLRQELPLADLSASGIREFRKLLGDYNLQLAAVHYPTRRGYEEPTELDRRIDGTRQAMKVAAQLGARVVINRAYGKLPEVESPRYQQLLHALESLASEGSRVGARFAALTTASPVEELATLLRELPDGTVGVALHPANLLAGEQSPLESLEQLSPMLLHMYACDAVRDFSGSRATDVELGRGAADFPALLASLDARNYTGWFTVERLHVEDPIAEFGDAIAYLHNVGID